MWIGSHNILSITVRGAMEGVWERRRGLRLAPVAGSSGTVSQWYRANRFAICSSAGVIARDIAHAAIPPLPVRAAPRGRANGPGRGCSRTARWRQVAGPRARVLPDRPITPDGKGGIGSRRPTASVSYQSALPQSAFRARRTGVSRLGVSSTRVRSAFHVGRWSPAERAAHGANLKLCATAAETRATRSGLSLGGRSATQMSS
jgi:hypothetical protein